MAKKVVGQVKLQITAGAANPSPPVGPALGQRGVNIMEFCKAFNAQTQNMQGLIIPVIVTVFADRSFTFITKSPPASVLLIKASGACQGFADPQQEQGRQGRPAPRSRKSPKPRSRISTPRTWKARSGRSKAPPARWASMWSAKTVAGSIEIR